MSYEGEVRKRMDCHGGGRTPVLRLDPSRSCSCRASSPRQAGLYFGPSNQVTRAPSSCTSWEAVTPLLATIEIDRAMSSGPDTRGSSPQNQSNPCLVGRLAECGAPTFEQFVVSAPGSQSPV